LKTIEITVTPTGQTTIETKGFSGAECRQASQFIEAALGNRIQERMTGEFYSRAEQQPRLQEGA
jgi:Protein of unknown function (DUF2997)